MHPLKKKDIIEAFWGICDGIAEQSTEVFGIPHWGFFEEDAAELITTVDLQQKVSSGSAAGDLSTLCSLKQPHTSCVYEE